MNNLITDNDLEQVNKFIDGGFPLRNFILFDLQKDYIRFCNKEYDKKSNTCLNIIEAYHPSIWRCNIKNHLAPIDAWYDEATMLKVLKNRQKYLEKDDLTPIDIRAGLTISKIAPKVSIFRPALAKYLIKKYLYNFNSVFDPCSGFSGRMLGACSLGKLYIGLDINSITVAESNEIIKNFNLNANILEKNSIYDSGNYECLLTCPPYGDKEIWHQDIEVLSTDEWIETCLSNYKCKKYLFVIDKTEKYKNYIVEEISNASHLNKNTEKIILIERE